MKAEILTGSQYLDLFHLLNKKLLNYPLLEKEGYFFQKRVKMTLCHIEKFLSIYIVIFFPLFPLQEMKFQFHLNRAYFPPFLFLYFFSYFLKCIFSNHDIFSILNI